MLELMPRNKDTIKTENLIFYNLMKGDKLNIVMVIDNKLSIHMNMVDSFNFYLKIKTVNHVHMNAELG